MWDLRVAERKNDVDSLERRARQNRNPKADLAVHKLERLPSIGRAIKVPNLAYENDFLFSASSSNMVWAFCQENDGFCISLHPTAAKDANVFVVAAFQPEIRPSGFTRCLGISSRSVPL